MLREIISRCKTIKYCADNFTQDFGLDLLLLYLIKLDYYRVAKYNYSYDNDFHFHMNNYIL